MIIKIIIMMIMIIIIIIIIIILIIIIIKGNRPKRCGKARVINQVALVLPLYLNFEKGGRLF